ncbi:hypothetical protein ACFC5Z_19020, partial [Streptomyces sp. NPDC056004]|uniref:hypothetical protein n=1 Tax=Streptomyces sp. NPDC056004 TaxID=3345677 RepID=UPI0035DE433A
MRPSYWQVRQVRHAYRRVVAEVPAARESCAGAHESHTAAPGTGIRAAGRRGACAAVAVPVRAGAGGGR